jgi:hypothetical protein
MSLSNRQLSLMKDQFTLMEGQLYEMQQARVLTNQPFPWCSVSEVKLDNPRIFFDPHTGDTSMQCRLHISFLVKNVGSSLAVNIDLLPTVFVRCDDDVIELESSSSKFEYLETDKEAKSYKTFLDDDHNILNSFVNRTFNDFPVLDVLVIYKNFLGATFAIECSYLLLPKSEDRNHMKDWLKTYAAAQVEYSTAINEISSTFERSHESAREKWNCLEENFNKSFSTFLTEPIILQASFIEDSLKMGPTEEEGHEKLVNTLGYEGALCSSHPLKKPV